MPAQGRKPAEDSMRRGPSRAELKWTPVVDTPYRGPVPVLPSERTVIQRGQEHTYPLQEMTRQWWSTVSAMPHCVLWTDSDWMFALTTALVADQAFTGVASASTELRNREKVLGVTADARRDLRIKYVTAEQVAEQSGEKPAAAAEKVASLTERRRRLTGAS